MNTPVRRLPANTRPRPWLAVAVAFALLLPILSPLGGVVLWGWLPDHGHAGVLAAAPHHHPWDKVAAHDHAAPGTTATPVAPDQIGFTAGDLAGAPALPVLAVGLLAVPALLRLPVRATSSLHIVAPALLLEPPPPR